MSSAAVKFQPSCNILDSADGGLVKDIAGAFWSAAFDPQGKSAGNVHAIDAVDAKYHTA